MWQLQEFCTDEKISDKNRNSYAQSARNLNKYMVSTDLTQIPITMQNRESSSVQNLQ